MISNNNRQPCDRSCPSLETPEAVQLQNYGCLPCPYEVKQILEKGEVWMCHSTPGQPCVATGLTAVPEGFTAITGGDYQMIRTWWINNAWRFWQIEWALAGDPNRAFEIWTEYHYMLDPTDERSLVDLIFEEYDHDVESAMRNPVVKLVFWVRRVAVGFRKSGGRVF